MRILPKTFFRDGNNDICIVCNEYTDHPNGHIWDIHHVGYVGGEDLASLLNWYWAPKQRVIR